MSVWACSWNRLGPTSMTARPPRQACDTDQQKAMQIMRRKDDDAGFWRNTKLAKLAFYSDVSPHLPKWSSRKSFKFAKTPPSFFSFFLLFNYKLSHSWLVGFCFLWISLFFLSFFLVIYAHKSGQILISCFFRYCQMSLFLHYLLIHGSVPVSPCCVWIIKIILKNPTTCLLEQILLQTQSECVFFLFFVTLGCIWRVL